MPWVCADLIRWQNVFEVPKFDSCTCAGVFSPQEGLYWGRAGQDVV